MAQLQCNAPPDTGRVGDVVSNRQRRYETDGTCSPHPLGSLWPIGAGHIAIASDRGAVPTLHQCTSDRGRDCAEGQPSPPWASQCQRKGDWPPRTDQAACQLRAGQQVAPAGQPERLAPRVGHLQASGQRGGGPGAQRNADAGVTKAHRQPRDQRPRRHGNRRERTGVAHRQRCGRGAIANALLGPRPRRRSGPVVHHAAGLVPGGEARFHQPPDQIDVLAVAKVGVEPSDDADRPHPGHPGRRRRICQPGTRRDGTTDGPEVQG